MIEEVELLTMIIEDNKLNNSLQKKFQDRVDLVTKHKSSVCVGHDTMLQLYKFYKQATVGDVNLQCPSMFNLVGRAKWQAWNSTKGMHKEQAMESYINIVNELMHWTLSRLLASL